MVLVALALVAGARADAPPAAVVSTRVAPERPTVGERFRYEQVVDAPRGTVVDPPPRPERLGDFDVIDAGVEPPVEHGDRVTATRWWQLVGWRTGEHAVAGPAVRVREPGAAPRDLAVDPAPVVVASVLGVADETSDIRDIKGPEPVPPALAPWLLGAAALAALALGAFVLRRRRARGVPVAPPALRPAHEVATEALRALAARRLPEQGAFKEFYAALSDVVRRYLEDRFRVRAPEMTTEEFLAATARGGALDAAHRELLGGFLAESDLVKFARHVPALADATRAFDAAGRFVDETASRPQAPAEEARATG